MKRAFISSYLAIKKDNEMPKRRRISHKVSVSIQPG